MADTFTTPYMSLILPTPLVRTGPLYATDLNTAMLGVDSHNHVTGSGVQVPTAGLNINADLSFGGFSAIQMKAATFNLQTSFTTPRSMYFKGSDLYVRDNSGAEIQMTSGGQVNVSGTGGFSGDFGTSGVTASVPYSNTSKTYSFLQASGQRALMDQGETLIRQTIGTGYAAVHLKSTLNNTTDSDVNFTLPKVDITMPTSHPGSTSILVISSAGAISPSSTWPSAPSATSLLSMDTSGNVSASGSPVDGVTLQYSSGILSVQSGAGTGTGTAGIGTTQLVDQSVTNAKIANGTIVGAGTGTTKFVAGTIGTADIGANQVTLSQIAARSVTASSTINSSTYGGVGSWERVGGIGVNYITSFAVRGGPVWIGLQDNGSGNPGYVELSSTFAGSSVDMGAQIGFSADGGSTFFFQQAVRNWQLDGSSSSSGQDHRWPAGGFQMLWSPGAGTYNISVWIQVVRSGSPGDRLGIYNCKLVAYEL